MTTIADRINEGLRIRGLKPVDLVKSTGIGKSSISSYLSGKYEPKQQNLYRIAKALNVSEAWLMGHDVPITRHEFCNETNENYSHFKHPIITNDTVTFPVIGEIAAGYDSIAVEDWSGETVEVPSVYLKGRKYEDYIVLAVKGDSMYPHYMEGDKVLILRQSCVNSNGDVGAVIYNDEMATLKKIFTNSDHVELVPINPEYKPKRIDGEEMDHVRILGIPKMLIREFNN